MSLIFTGRALTGIEEFINATISAVDGLGFAVSFLSRIGGIQRKS
jgi:hypothetical protein